MRNFRIYQASVEFYRGCKALPLPPYIKDQLLRAAASVSLNICEGYGRISLRDKRRFYKIALGSCRESRAALELEGVSDQVLLDRADFIAAGLYKLITKDSS